MNGRIQITIAAMAAILVLSGLGAVWLMRPKPAPLPVLGKAPSFLLTDSEDQRFTAEILDGKIWVADFFFTTCPGPCPVMSKNMQRLHQTFAGEANLHLVNFSVDPENDTPAVLRKYAARFDADTTRWHFLTGPPAQIYGIATEGFKIGDPDALIRHSQKFVLIDGTGQIRGYYDGIATAEIDELIGHIRQLL